MSKGGKTNAASRSSQHHKISWFFHLQQWAVNSHRMGWKRWPKKINKNTLNWKNSLRRIEVLNKYQNLGIYLPTIKCNRINAWKENYAQRPKASQYFYFTKRRT